MRTRKAKANGHKTATAAVAEVKDRINTMLTRHGCEFLEKEWLLNAFTYCLEGGRGFSAEFEDRLDEHWLAHWVEWQKEDYRDGKLTADQIRSLETLPSWTWE